MLLRIIMERRITAADVRTSNTVRFRELQYPRRNLEAQGLG